jgi:hypothetical protein
LLRIALVVSLGSEAVAETVVRGRHFRVVCHYGAGREAAAALSAAESVWPLAARFYGLPVDGPRPLMDIHLYRTMSDYAAAEWPLTRGRFRHSGAFTAHRTKAAYVAVQPDCADEILRRHGLPLLTRMMIAHEACHVVGLHATNNFRLHPDWYAEGFATWAASKALLDHRGPGLEADPYAGRLMVRLKKLDEAGRLPRVEQVLSGDMRDLSYHERYAVWWSLFELLMDGPHNRAFGAVTEDVNTGRCGPDPGSYLQQTVPKRLSGLEERLVAAVRARRPAWDEFRRSLEVTGEGLTQRAFIASEALAWSAEPAGDGPYAIRGRVTLLPGFAHTARVLIGRTDEGYWSVEFSGGGRVRLVRIGAGVRTGLAMAHVAGCRVGVPVGFSIEVGDGRLRLRVNGRTVLDASSDEHPVSGAWGLGLDPGAAALWNLSHHPGPPVTRSHTRLPRKPGKLSAIIRKDPDSDRALEAVGALAACGRPGLQALGAVLARHRRSHPVVAELAAKLIAESNDPLRVGLLRRHYHGGLAPGPAGRILAGLASRYPADAEWFHAALAPGSKVAHKAAIFLEVAPRGLPVERVRQCLGDVATAGPAYVELLRRGQRVVASELGLVARTEAPMGTSIDYVAEFRDRLRRGSGWELLKAIAELVKDEDDVVRTGAHALMLGVSGRDVVAEPLLWRSWIAARRDRYEMPDALSDGSVAAAVVRGAAYLRRQLLRYGSCVYGEGTEDVSPRRAIGATALAIKALRAAGVPSSDPAIVRAIEETILTRNRHGQLVLNRDGKDNNYVAALMVIALASVDAKRYRSEIQALAGRIAAGQLESGQWTYGLRDRYARKDRGPRRLVGDASNTQYALLGLRAAMKAGADIDPEVWRRSLQMYRETQDPWGGWGYIVVPFSGNERTMTSAAIAGLVFCLEALHGEGAAQAIARSEALRRGLVRQGQLLIRWGYRGFDHYAFYGIERACVVTGTRYFNRYDWYRAGALDLLRRQKDDGSWHGRAGGHPAAGSTYGPHIDTAYALLFLKRATTAVAGLRRDRRVVCPPGPDRTRGNPVLWWPWKPKSE